jgi:hypothetical protein
LRTIRAAVILAGFVMLLFGLRILGRSYSTTRWPITPGRIVASAIVPAGDRYEAHVEYEYILAGRVRRGRLPATPTTRDVADSMIASYPVGREIPVGFDPGDPASSVLRPVIRWWSLALILAGAGLMVAGVRYRKTPA